MTKQELQKELNEVVKEGVKPSHLKKLKRSKSAGDILKAPPLPTSTPLSKRQSQQSFKDPKYPYTTLISQQEKLDRLQKETVAKSDTIKLLRKKIEDLEKNNLPTQLLQNQLSEKQKQIETLKKQLEEKHTSTETSTELDQHLIARHKSLKDWFTQYSKNKALDQELKENIDEASGELEKQDNLISNLRSENRKLKQHKESLQKDLDLATKLAELRKSPLPNPESTNYLKYGLCFGVLALTVWLLTKN